MEHPIYYEQRQQGYKDAQKETKESGRPSFDSQIKLRLFQWWADWAPDNSAFEGFFGRIKNEIL